MHPGAFEFVGRYATAEAIRVIEIGSRIINDQTSIRTLFPNAEWTGLDLREGPGVDVICDAEEYLPAVAADLVICCEVCEHTFKWRGLISSSAHWLGTGGMMLLTCAGPGRERHSAIDGGPELHHGEWYRNVWPSELAAAIEAAKLTLRILETNQHWRDVYAAALRH